MIKLLTKNNRTTAPVYIVLILLFSIIIFFDTWKSLVEIWIRSDTFAHGFLVIPGSLWLIWQNKSLHHQLSVTTPSLLGISFIILNGLFWLFSSITQTLVIQQLALVGMLIGSYWFYLGNSTSRKIIFPLFFLYFMVPMGEEQLLPPLMEYTADFTVALLRLTGITVYREGLHFSLVSGNWSVVEACSGIRYLIASITLGTIYAYITYSKAYKRILFIIISIIIPVIANGFRAYMIVMIGHLSGMKLATGVDHIVYGALFFAIVIFILFFIGSFWKDSTQAFDKKHTINKDKQTYTKQKNIIVLMAIGVSLIVWPYSNQQLQSHYHAQTTIPELPFLAKNTQWEQVDAPDWGWRPQFNGVSTESLRYFKHQNYTIGFYQTNFGDEQQGSEMVNMKNQLIKHKDRNTWHFIKQSTTSLQLPKSEKAITVDLAEIRGNNQDIIVAKWYQLGHQNTNSPYLAKLYQLYKRLTLDTSPEIYNVIFTKKRNIQDNSAIIIETIINLKEK